MNSKSEGIERYNRYLQMKKDGFELEAGHLLRSAVKLGEPMALHALAYQKMQKDPKEIKAALSLYRRAAKSGFAPSAWNLARYYESRKVRKEYFRWLSRALQIGDPDALIEMVHPAPYIYKAGLELLEHGSLDQARSLIDLAAKWGNPDAQKRAARL